MILRGSARWFSKIEIKDDVGDIDDVGDYESFTNGESLDTEKGENNCFYSYDGFESGSGGSA